MKKIEEVTLLYEISNEQLSISATNGIDFSTKGELIAAQHTVDEVKNFIGLDSLCYLSLSGMLEATGLEQNGFCLACFDGKYPIQPEEGFSKPCLE